MTSRQTLEADLKAAMRSGDEVRKSVLRMAISAVKLAEVEARGPLDDAGVASVLQKEIKAARESIADAEKAGRPDLISAEAARLAVLEGYLPEQLTPDEIEGLAREAIAQTQASSPADVGKVMKVLQPKVKGLADGKLVNQVVRQLLSQG